MKIRSKQAVYLGADRKSVFPENHPDAAFLLVGAGAEIEESEMEKYSGADKLVNAEAKPYMTVTDSKVVAGKVVDGDKVKMATATDGPSPAVPNENPANDQAPAADSSEKAAPPAAPEKSSKPAKAAKASSKKAAKK